MLCSFKHREQKWSSKIHLLIIIKTLLHSVLFVLFTPLHMKTPIEGMFLCTVSHLWSKNTVLGQSESVINTHKRWLVTEFQKYTNWHIVCIQRLLKLDVDPRRDDDASPMSTYRCMLRPTWMISALWHKSKFNFELKKSQTKYKSKFNF